MTSETLLIAKVLERDDANNYASVGDSVESIMSELESREEVQITPDVEHEIGVAVEAWWNANHDEDSE